MTFCSCESGVASDLPPHSMTSKACVCLPPFYFVGGQAVKLIVEGVDLVVGGGVVTETFDIEVGSGKWQVA